MKSYKFKYPFQGNRKGDIVTDDKHGQLLVKAGSNNVMWGPKDVFRAVGMGLIEEENKESSVDKSIISQKLEKLPRIPPLTSWSDFPTTKRPVLLFGEFPMPECIHTGFTIRESDELFCTRCKKRWDANEQA